MARPFLTRLAVAAGTLAPASAVGQAPAGPPATPPQVVWVRPGTPQAAGPAAPPAAADEPIWVRPGGLPARRLAVDEVRAEKPAPLIVPVEAREEPAPPAPIPLPAVPPDGWHRVGSSRDLPELVPPPPEFTGSPTTDSGTTGETTDAPKREGPKTWHGHKYPVQAFAPPGGFPILPTGPGYYTLLDEIRGNFRDKPPRWPYPRSGPIMPPFNEIDFTYLDAIPFDQRDWAERLHRVPVGDHWLFSTGGEFRTRYNYETNSRLSGKDNTYQLFRNRLYTDVWFEDYFRVYTEFLYGDSIWQDLPPLTRDVNRGDIQQLFADVRLGEINGNPIYLRAGRQELLYGSQRLVSTNDWGNNRTRFDGLKLFYRSETLDADAFLTRPTQVRFGQLDPWDRNQTFSGAWLTYKPKAGTFVDLYYLDLENDNPGAAKGQFKTGSFNVSTFGGRYYGRHDSGLLLDFEGMLQFGHWADQSILAQAFSGYVGWYFKDCWATPTVWAGYDYASGDPDPNNTGQHRTFNQLFQFGHYYYGFIDITGGQNIRDWNVQAYAYPTNWMTTGIQYHVFRLDSNKDALYNAAGQATRQDRTGRAGDNVGSEIDVLVNFHLTDRQDVFLNYCHFFPGPFIQATGPSFGLDYVYLQYSLRW
jgi:hypothetical protein